MELALTAQLTLESLMMAGFAEQMRAPLLKSCVKMVHVNTVENMEEVKKMAANADLIHALSVKS